MLLLQFATGWFSQHMINCIRQRLMVRFLSVFPKPGAENLLRAATLKFEKLRRETYRHAMKLDEEECQQPNLGSPFIYFFFFFSHSSLYLLLLLL